MDVLVILIPVSLFLGGLGLVGFFWTLRRGQYDDPEGDARRILNSDYDDAPAAGAAPPSDAAPAPREEERR